MLKPRSTRSESSMSLEDVKSSGVSAHQPLHDLREDGSLWSSPQSVQSKVILWDVLTVDEVFLTVVSEVGSL